MDGIKKKKKTSGLSRVEWLLKWQTRRTRLRKRHGVNETSVREDARSWLDCRYASACGHAR